MDAVKARKAKRNEKERKRRHRFAQHVRIRDGTSWNVRSGAGHDHHLKFFSLALLPCFLYSWAKLLRWSLTRLLHLRNGSSVKTPKSLRSVGSKRRDGNKHQCHGGRSPTSRRILTLATVTHNPGLYLSLAEFVISFITRFLTLGELIIIYTIVPVCSTI